MLQRLRAHRLLIAAALLATLLTTSVLAALTAFSGSLGDAALRSTLDGRSRSAASLVVEAGVPRHKRDAAQRAVERGAREAFAGLPVTVRRLERSGPYALPRSPRSADTRTGQPDLTLLAALDRSRIDLVAGTLPGAAPASRSGAVPVAVPEPAAHRLKLRPGARLTLTDRLGGEPVRVRVTGVYRAADGSDPYWQADTLGGHGVRTGAFTTYGPLLADAAVLASGRVTTGGTGWVATADHRGLTTGSLGALRTATVRATARLRGEAALGGSADVRTGLPEVLDRTERALLVSRSTLLIVSLQLVLLAGYALLLVARLLNGARAGETRLLRARGASRGRIASLAGLEALLLAVPAAVCAALLSGPLARLLAGWSSLDRIGLRPGTAPSGGAWLVAGGVALACAAAVAAPALTGAAGAPARLRRVRAATSAAPVRAGADLALLLIAGVAYWQLQRQAGGVTGRDRAGRLGTDPLLVAAPALALLAGTVLTLRVLPFAARFAERWSANGRGLPAALAGWQFSRRPLRGAGPVLLLIVAVATGMLAIGHGASWDRSQRDQADFRTGAAVRILDPRPGSPGQTGLYAALPRAREAVPAHRTALNLSGAGEVTVLALDTSRAGDVALMRGDLADGPTGGAAAGPGPAPARRRPGRAASRRHPEPRPGRADHRRAGRHGTFSLGPCAPADGGRRGRVRHRLPAGRRERPGGRPDPPRHAGAGPHGGGPPRRAGRTAAADRTATRRHRSRRSRRTAPPHRRTDPRRGPRRLRAHRADGPGDPLAGRPDRDPQRRGPLPRLRRTGRVGHRAAVPAVHDRSRRRRHLRCGTGVDRAGRHRRGAGTVRSRRRGHPGLPAGLGCRARRHRRRPAGRGAAAGADRPGGARTAHHRHRHRHRYRYGRAGHGRAGHGRRGAAARPAGRRRRTGAAGHRAAHTHRVVGGRRAGQGRRGGRGAAGASRPGGAAGAGARRDRGGSAARPAGGRAACGADGGRGGRRGPGRRGASR
ncbi:FtsX-like permease family protein [Streptomyces sudanensis]|uniref:FtsX-like permease family protein n=1 Tax=Streptomyces sudanensis TaxID=436397 RepID=UPI003FD712B3